MFITQYQIYEDILLHVLHQSVRVLLRLLIRPLSSKIAYFSMPPPTPLHMYVVRMRWV